MSLLPRSPKEKNSAPQLPEKKQQFSTDPQNPWGPPEIARSQNQPIYDI